jgi:hypothetical protein
MLSCWWSPAAADLAFVKVDRWLGIVKQQLVGEQLAAGRRCDRYFLAVQLSSVLLLEAC